MNEEFLVNACHQQALNTFLVFVHTARRCYRLNGSMSSKEFSAPCAWSSNYLKLYHLEEAKVVKRYRYVNLPMDNYTFTFVVLSRARVTRVGSPLLHLVCSTRPILCVVAWVASVCGVEIPRAYAYIHTYIHTHRCGCPAFQHEKHPINNNTTPTQPTINWIQSYSFYRHCGPTAATT